jgi:hypothetical protein
MPTKRKHFLIRPDRTMIEIIDQLKRDGVNISQYMRDSVEQRFFDEEEQKRLERRRKFRK